MQLSFPVPSESSPPSPLAGVTCVDGASGDSAAAASTPGFAQLLAGIGTGNAAAVPPVPVLPGPAAASFATSAPATLGTVASVTEGASPVLPMCFGVPRMVGSFGTAVAPLPGESSGVVVDTDSDSSSDLVDLDPEVMADGAPESPKKSLAALGDLQACAVLAAQLPIVPAPVVPLPAAEATASSVGEPAALPGTPYRGFNIRSGEARWDRGNATKGAPADLAPVAKADGKTPVLPAISFPNSPAPTREAAAIQDGSTVEVPPTADPLPVATPSCEIPSSKSSELLTAVPEEVIDATNSGELEPAIAPSGKSGAVRFSSDLRQWKKSASAPIAEARRGAKDADLANFAAERSVGAGGARTVAKPLAKSFLGAQSKEVTEGAPNVGTGVADSSPTMPAGSTLARSNTSDVAAVTATATSSEVRAEASPLPQPVALTSTAHRAVEAVLSATERFAARDQHSVDLQFSVGGADLKVRVELRAGEVHTTFRTDSDELRAALSNEWQSVATTSDAERPVRLAPPVFASSGGNGGAPSDDGASRQRGHQSQGTPSERFTSGSSSRLSVSSAPSFGTAAVAPSRSASANSVHLHTLA